MELSCTQSRSPSSYGPRGGAVRGEVRAGRSKSMAAGRARGAGGRSLGGVMRGRYRESCTEGVQIMLKPDPPRPFPPPPHPSIAAHSPSDAMSPWTTRASLLDPAEVACAVGPVAAAGSAADWRRPDRAARRRAFAPPGWAAGRASTGAPSCSAAEVSSFSLQALSSSDAR